jgi:hypothetical protein
MSTTLIIGRFAQRRAAIQRSHRQEYLISIGVNTLLVGVALLVYLVIGACRRWSDSQNSSALVYALPVMSS